LGRPVLSTPYAYARDLLSPYPELLIPYGDADAWARAITAHLSDPGRLQEWERKIRQIGKEMNWPRVGERHLKLFGELSQLRRSYADRSENIASASRKTDPSETAHRRHGYHRTRHRKNSPAKGRLLHRRQCPGPLDLRGMGKNRPSDRGRRSGGTARPPVRHVLGILGLGPKGGRPLPQQRRVQPPVGRGRTVGRLPGAHAVVHGDRRGLGSRRRSFPHRPAFVPERLSRRRSTPISPGRRLQPFGGLPAPARSGSESPARTIVPELDFAGSAGDRRASGKRADPALPQALRSGMAMV